MEFNEDMVWDYYHKLSYFNKNMLEYIDFKEHENFKNSKKTIIDEIVIIS
jgi:hypothetical protein